MTWLKTQSSVEKEKIFHWSLYLKTRSDCPRVSWEPDPGSTGEDLWSVGSICLRGNVVTNRLFVLLFRFTPVKEFWKPKPPDVYTLCPKSSSDSRDPEFLFQPVNRVVTVRDEGRGRSKLWPGSTDDGRIPLSVNSTKTYLEQQRSLDHHLGRNFLFYGILRRVGVTQSKDKRETHKNWYIHDIPIWGHYCVNHGYCIFLKELVTEE